MMASVLSSHGVPSGAGSGAFHLQSLRALLRLPRSEVARPHQTSINPDINHYYNGELSPLIDY